ncbi:MAG: NADH-quinone oxidoreductase subunit G [Nocardioidaceae bacterium]
MTVQSQGQSRAGGQDAALQKLVTLTIDDVEVSVPEGTLVIRAAELIGVQVPRFCDHPLLDPVGACRQCLVEVPDAGNGRPIPKPQASCTLPVTEGMVVRTQVSSAVADKAQQGIMEFLLINHPLDCPVCDKGGECPLQNQAMSNGRGESRYVEQKRTFPKPVNISAQVLLDRERCILCARCTRFQQEIAGDPFIDMLERGALQQVGIYEKEPFESYFSGNTIQICPVGALTSAAYRFRSRPFDLVSTPSVCEHCASGCALRTDHRRGKVTRRLAGDDPAVNEEWNCDKGRFAFHYARQADRLTNPLVRDDETGELRPASWPEAFVVAARGIEAANGHVGVLAGGRLTAEDAYAYSKFARAVIGTNDVDFRARPHSVEEADFLAAEVAARSGVTYADIEAANAVVLAGFEPEEESPIVFLRLRKAFRKHGVRVFSVAPLATRGLQKVGGRLLPTAPGGEASALAAVADNGEVALDGGGVILVGERLAMVPGALSAVLGLARTTGARLAWVPRRAGERGALEAGCLPGLLPGGRPVADASARVDVAAAWGVDALPSRHGRSTDEMLAAAVEGELGALVVGGVELNDLADPHAARAALSAVPFLVSLEVRSSEVTELADVVFPVAPVAEKAGTFVDWEGRQRPFDNVLETTGVLPDLRVLAGIAEEMLEAGSGRRGGLGFRTVAQVRTEMTELGPWDGKTSPPPQVPGSALRSTTSGQALLATWRHLIDDGRSQDGEPYLKATGKAAVALVSAATAADLGVAGGDSVTLSTERGSLSLAVSVADVVDGVVWVPQNSGGASLHRDLGAVSGDVVSIQGGAA